MASQQQSSTTPVASRDRWQTPQWLFDWADKRFMFEIDLAASKENAKVYAYIDKDGDALSADWSGIDKQGLSGGYGFCNPPYSEPGKWLKKAWHEAQQGFQSVFLVPCPNGEAYWQEAVFGKASEIIFITGRVAFELPDLDGEPVPKSGNTRGSCFVVFNRSYPGPTSINYINRDDMKKEFEQC
ncbi:MAG: DNA N-6-adenine-methyltransferase [Methylophaga sp.]|nr:DNA N-6-adenine-methyltransferase [Methylophaga sp.]